MSAWHDIAPADAADLDLTSDLTVTAPLNEAEERCRWPWFPQELPSDLGYVRCFFCDARVLAGVPHLDYARHWRAIAPADRPRAAVWLREGATPASVVAALTGEDENLLRAASCNAERVLFADDGEDLRNTLGQLGAEYEDDRPRPRVSRAYGAERFDFRDGITVFIRRINGPWRRATDGHR